MLPSLLLLLSLYHNTQSVICIKFEREREREREKRRERKKGREEKICEKECPTKIGLKFEVK